MFTNPALVSETTFDKDNYHADQKVTAGFSSFDVPFGRLMMFFIKAVFAAIPALLLLTVLLWLFGQGLQSTFPQLLKMKILIYVPQ